MVPGPSSHAVRLTMTKYSSARQRDSMAEAGDARVARGWTGG